MTTIQPKSLGSFVRSLSGLFITKENPNGLTPKECTILAAICFLLRQDENLSITKEIRIKLSNMTNYSTQVVTNYINIFKKKGAITKYNKLHPIFYQNKVVIEWKE